MLNQLQQASAAGRVLETIRAQSSADMGVLKLTGTLAPLGGPPPPPPLPARTPTQALLRAMFLSGAVCGVVVFVLTAVYAIATRQPAGVIFAVAIGTLAGIGGAVIPGLFIGVVAQRRTIREKLRTEEHIVLIAAYQRREQLRADLNEVRVTPLQARALLNDWANGVLTNITI